MPGLPATLAYPRTGQVAGQSPQSPRLMKVVRKDAVNVSALTAKAPREVVAEIFRACGRCRVAVSSTGQYSVKCSKAAGPQAQEMLRFEMDVARIDGDERLVVRGKRLAGDFRLYKELCADILREMDL